jgi:hypothetical protein
MLNHRVSFAQTLDPQECFNKALVRDGGSPQTCSKVATTKKYTTAEMQRLRAVCCVLADQRQDGKDATNSSGEVTGRRAVEKGNGSSAGAGTTPQ